MRPARFRVAACLVFMFGFVTDAGADQIEDIINQVTLDEYQSYLRVLTGVDPVPGGGGHHLQSRYSFGDDIHLAGQWIHDHFDAQGLDASFHVFDNRYGPNVIGELPGSSRPQDIYLITAHYDTYHHDNQLQAPGCDDNGSGTAAVMTAARILSGYEFEGTLRFVAFSGEEQWMVGSQAYTQEARNRGENLVAAINLDMILHPAFDNQPDPDYDLDIGGNGASQWLAGYMADQLGEYTPIEFEIHNRDDFVSDQWSFWQHGYDAVGLAENTPWEIWGGSNRTYHQITDTIDNPHWDWDFGLHSVRGGMAGLAGLAVVAHLTNCDFDSNGACDIGDIDALGMEILAGTNDPDFDLTNDDLVNNDDRDKWLELAGTENGFSEPYQLADSDLNGIVDGPDFVKWNSNKFAPPDPLEPWSTADWDFNGFVDGQDFILWNANKFQSITAAVPEPTGLLLIVIAIAGLRRRPRSR